MPENHLTPLKAIRQKCLADCTFSQREEVKMCPAKDCPLHGMRHGKKGKGKSCLKTIRSKCLDCSGLQLKEVRNCEHKDCPLYIYRMGKNPNRHGIGGNGLMDTT